MQKKYFIIIALLVLILIILGINVKTNNRNSVQVKEQAVKKLTSDLPTPKITTVKLTDEGFDPKTVKIKAGEAITWINEGNKDASVNSAEHPTHKLYTFLNLGLFSSGSSIQTQFPNKGTFKYHNHLAPSQTGTVIVE